MKNALAVAVVIAAALGLASPAVAGHGSWAFGAGFQVGGVHFQIGYQDRGGAWGHPHFRMSGPLRYPGYVCSDACYRTGGAWYHHHTCPLLHNHFRRHGYEPWSLIGAYGPPAVPYAYRGPRAYGYGSPYGYRPAPYPYGYRYDYRAYPPRHHRHDSWRGYDRHHRDRGYDRHHRDRGYDRRHRDRGYDRHHRGRGHDRGRGHHDDRGRGRRDD